MVLVDTNVLLDISTKDPNWFAWSGAQLEPLIDAREAAINPVICAELAPAFSSAADSFHPEIFTGGRCPTPPHFPQPAPSRPTAAPAARAPCRCRIFSSVPTSKWKISSFSPAIRFATAPTFQTSASSAHEEDRHQMTVV